MCTIKIGLLFNAQNTPTFKRMKLMTSTKTREDKMDTECKKDEGPRSLSRAEIELQYFREVLYIDFYIICRKHKCINIFILSFQDCCSFLITVYMRRSNIYMILLKVSFGILKSCCNFSDIC